MIALLIPITLVVLAAIIYAIAAQPMHRNNGVVLEHEIDRPRRFTQGGWR